MITLANGSRYFVPEFTSKRLIIDTLRKSHYQTFFELVTKCRDETYEISDSHRMILQKLEVMDVKEKIYAVVKDIILTSVEGEGNDMKLKPFMSFSAKVTAKL